MSAVETIELPLNESAHPSRSIMGAKANILSDIYREDINIVIWQRSLSLAIQDAVHQLLESDIKVSIRVAPSNVISALADPSINITNPALVIDIHRLVDMFCLLFDIKQVGLRITSLSNAMCPKFHVDRVPCRLVSSYCGVGTEWLAHDAVDRTRLGHGSNGLADHESGLYKDKVHIHQMQPGDVSLLKGELWEGNEGAGLVHRSPNISNGQKRLLLTLDFIN